MSDVDAKHKVTRLIQAASASDRAAADQLLTLVYDQLRKIAQQRMSAERPDHTLQATALVHEAYFRLLGHTEVQWQNRAHFVAVAAEAMRRILVDRARQKRGIRHGGGVQRIDLASTDPPAPENNDDNLLALDEALTRLSEHHPEKSELVKLRHFGGMTLEQAAEFLGISRATASRHWEYARVWLLREMQGARQPETD